MPSTKLKLIKPDTIEHVKRRYGIIGNSPSLNHALAMALRVAPTTMNVLITGENGSGKESFSKVIHHYSSQKHGKLIAVNCGALPQGTIDSELFGHEKGAFTDAHEGRKGYFQEANHGTIFLDEIGEMPLSTQARLLRVLEYGEFIKVGSSKVEKTEVRVIAATHVDLKSAVAQGTFREDLYYRLNTVSLHIPPLRERGNDIKLLFKKFSADFAEEYGGQSLHMSEEAFQLLMAYPFPGNIRELKNLVVRLSVLEERNKSITPDQLNTYLPNTKDQHLPAPITTSLPETDRTLSEREILYKILFDMQRDLVELKKIVFEGLSNNTKGYHLLRKYPLLFDNILEKKTKTPQPIAALPPQEYPTIDHTTQKKNTKAPKNLSLDDEDIIPLETLEKKAIIHALQHYKNSRKKAAEALDIPERTLYRKIKKYNL